MKPSPNPEAVPVPAVSHPFFSFLFFVLRCLRFCKRKELDKIPIIFLGTNSVLKDFFT